MTHGYPLWLAVSLAARVHVEQFQRYEPAFVSARATVCDIIAQTKKDFSPSKIPPDRVEFLSTYNKMNS
jgi:hypothetical protein